MAQDTSVRIVKVFDAPIKKVRHLHKCQQTEAGSNLLESPASETTGD